MEGIDQNLQLLDKDPAASKAARDQLINDVILELGPAIRKIAIDLVDHFDIKINHEVRFNKDSHEVYIRLKLKPKSPDEIS